MGEILKNPLLRHFHLGGPDMERLVSGARRYGLVSPIEDIWATDRDRASLSNSIGGFKTVHHSADRSTLILVLPDLMTA